MKRKHCMKKKLIYRIVAICCMVVLLGMNLCGYIEYDVLHQCKKKPIIHAATTISTTENIKSLGIDVSKYQKNIDWEKVKNDGIKFAILRCGIGQDIVSQDDAYYEKNVSGCVSQNIPYGVYIYSYANTVEKAVGEANHVLRLVEGKNLSYPIYYDMEDKSILKDPDGNSNSKETIGKIAEAFVTTIENAGYKAAIYSGYSFANTNLTNKRFKTMDFWVARYNVYCRYSRPYQMWQFTSDGHVDGISGRVDMNYTIGTDNLVPITGASFANSNVNIQVGQVTELTYEIAPKNAYNKNMVWSSSNEDVVSVLDGKVMGLKQGMATITAKSEENGNVVVNCTVCVQMGDETEGESVIIVDDSNNPDKTNTSTVVPSTNQPIVTGAAVTTESATVAPSVTKLPATEVPSVVTSATISPEPQNDDERDWIVDIETAQPAPNTATPKPTKIPATATPNVPKVEVGAPKNFTFTAVSKNEIKLNWSKVSKANGYIVYGYDSSSKKYAKLQSLDAKSVECTIKKIDGKKLSPGTKYKFQIRAYQTKDNEKYYGKYVKQTAITKPDNIKITNTKRLNSKKAKITWKKISKADGYIVYISTKKYGLYQVAATVKGKSKKTCMIKNLKKGVKYYVHVIAYQEYQNVVRYGGYYATKTIKKK